MDLLAKHFLHVTCVIYFEVKENAYSLSHFPFMLFLPLVCCLLCFRTLENIVLVHYRETHEVCLTITHLLS